MNRKIALILVGLIGFTASCSDDEKSSGPDKNISGWCEKQESCYMSVGAEGNIFIGKVTEVLYNKKYTYIRCNKLIIPLIDNYLKEINLEKNIIYVKNIGELNEN